MQYSGWVNRTDTYQIGYNGNSSLFGYTVPSPKDGITILETNVQSREVCTRDRQFDKHPLTMPCQTRHYIPIAIGSKCIYGPYIGGSNVIIILHGPANSLCL